MSNAAVTAATARRQSCRSRPGQAGSGFVSRLVIIVPYLWLLFFFLVPFVIVFKISLSQTAIAMPPYTPVLDFSDGIAGFFAQLQRAQLRQLRLADAGRALLQRLSHPASSSPPSRRS